MKSLKSARQKYINNIDVDADLSGRNRMHADNKRGSVSMKIDIHVHTKKVKSGDPESREIDPKTFYETLLRTNVRICAITNHNHFDLAQYKSIMEHSKRTLLVWPGVELDVIENGRRCGLVWNRLCRAELDYEEIGVHKRMTGPQERKD